MTQNKNTQANEQSGTTSNQQTRDGKNKVTDLQNPTANKENRTDSADSKQRPVSANQQNSQPRPSASSNPNKNDKNSQNLDEHEETEDKEMVVDEEIPDKRKTDNPDWSKSKPENPKIK